MRSAPHYPQTNGEAERLIGTFTKAVKCGGSGTHEKLELRLQSFLLKYMTTQYVTTNRTPADMLCNYRPTSRLDRLRSALLTHVNATEDRRPSSQNIGQTREYSDGDKVFVRFWYGTRRCCPGVVLLRGVQATYDVQLGDKLHRLHATQLLRDIWHRGLTLENEVAVETETKSMSRWRLNNRLQRLYLQYR